MKASLTFNLEDPDDAMSHFRCVKALDMALALYNIQEILRKAMQEDEPPPLANAIFNAFIGRGIVMEELVR